MKRKVLFMLSAVAVCLLACAALASDWVFTRESHSAVSWSMTMSEWSNWQIAAVKAQNLAGTGTVDTAVSVTYADGSTEALATLTNGAVWRPSAAVYLTRGDTLTVTGNTVWLTNGTVAVEYFYQRR